VVGHNYQKLGHYARDFPQPPVTCMYCRATNHEKKNSDNFGEYRGQEEPEQSECKMDCCGK
jgi:hypothetical protein